MKNVMVFLIASIALPISACKKDGPSASGSGQTPTYLPSGFEGLRLGMSEADLKAMYPAAKGGPPPSEVKAEYDGEPDMLYTVPINGDERFNGGNFCFINGRLLYAQLVVHPAKCTNEYLRGMASAMSKKTGEEIKEWDEGGEIRAAAYFGGCPLRC